MDQLVKNIIRDKIDTLEVEMSKHKQVEIEIKHYFANGLYAREMCVPKGILISGLVHATETIGIMTKGEMVIWNENGTKTRVKAPFTHTGKPGLKRVGYALEDVVWVTIHRTNLTDLLEIEKEQFVINEGDINMFDFNTGKVKDKILQDKHDFRQMLSEYGFSEEVVKSQSENTSDRIDVDLDGIGVAIRESLIHNVGVFAEKHFKKGDIIGPARLDGLRTQLGRYVNHSCKPNAAMVKLGDNIALMALTDINSEEITTDYRNSLSLSGIIPLRDRGTKCLA